MMTELYVMMAVKDGEREASGLYATEEQAEAALIAFAREWAETYGDKIADDLDACADYLATDAEIDYWIFSESVADEDDNGKPAGCS